MSAAPGALDRRLARRFLPFGLIGIAAPLTALVPPRPATLPVLGAVIAVTLVIGVAAVAAPWWRLPRWTFLVPPVAYLAVISLIQPSPANGKLGYSPLVVLPVVWVALHLGRRAVVATVGAGTLFFGTPFLLHGVAPGEARRFLILIGVPLAVGLTVNGLVTATRRHLAFATAQLERAERNEAALTVVAGIGRELATSGDVRQSVCAAACDASGASVASIAEPAGNTLAVTASTDVGLVGTLVPPRQAAAACRTRPTLGTARATTAHLPLVAHGKQQGLLVIEWESDAPPMSELQERTMSLVADEAAVAIERADLLRRLEAQALTDELTGLPNRRAWEDELARAVTRAHRAGAPLHVAIFDLDEFKLFNDHRGHMAGDDLLAAGGEAWAAAVRAGDFLARYGGEEFCVLLPGCDGRAATEVVERLRAATPFGQTASAGIAALRPGDDGGAVFARADKALYEAKRSGRDRTVIDETGVMVAWANTG